MHWLITAPIMTHMNAKTKYQNFSIVSDAVNATNVLVW